MTSKNFIFKVILLILLSVFYSNSVFCQNSDTLKQLPKLTLLNHKKVMADLFGEPKMEIKKIGILVYDNFDAMETIAPMVVFSELMNVEISYIGMHKGTASNDIIEIKIDKTLSDIKKLDILVVPGGDSKAIGNLLHDSTLLKWINNIDLNTKITLGIGNGTLLLGKCGVLKNKKVTGAEVLPEKNFSILGAKYVDQRFINDGKYWSSGASTASIDVCLALIKEIYGLRYLQAAMLDLEYNPKSPLKENKDLHDRVVDSVIANSVLIDGLTISKHLIYKNESNSQSNQNDSIGIFVYDGVFTLDFLGPLCVLSQLPNTTVLLIGNKKEFLKSGRTQLNIKHSISEIKNLDILLLPGGSLGTWKMAQDTAVRQWIKSIDTHSKYTTSVCTGAWILGEAGLLVGRKATTHWYHKEEMLEKYKAISQNERFIKDGKYWTSAGVSAGIDLSFALIMESNNSEMSEWCRYHLNYLPTPPINAGVPEKSDPLVVDMMTQMYDYMMLKYLNIEKTNK